MDTESTNKAPTCHTSGKWIVANNGKAFCSICGRGINEPLRTEVLIPEVSIVKELPKTVAEVFKSASEVAVEAEAQTVVNRDPLLTEREKTHGEFKKNAVTWEALCRSVQSDNFNCSQRLALNQLFLKVARAAQNPLVKEHWDDIAGYAKLAGEACSE